MKSPEALAVELSNLPAVGMDAFGFEFRLNDVTGQTDVSVHVRPEQARRVAAWAFAQEGLVGHGRWQRLGRFLDAMVWSGLPCDVWLEFDIERRQVPSVFCGVRPEHIANEQFLDAVRALSCWDERYAPCLRTSLNDAERFGDVSCIAVMLGRPNCDVRLCVDAGPDERARTEACPEFWAHPVLKEMVPSVDAWTLQLSVPRMDCLGLECFIQYGSVSKWNAVFQALGKYSQVDPALARWLTCFFGAARTISPDRFWPSVVVHQTRHVKISFDQYGRPSGKAYIGFIHR